MKIVITGGNGQLGIDCSKVLQAAHTVHSFGSKEVDITDQRRVSSCLQKIRPDVVINCGAYTGVDACETDWENCLRINRTGPEILAGEVFTIKSRLIHISTDYVFDGLKAIPEPYLESDPVNPLSRYGQSKLQGEEAICRVLENHLIIRTAWLYGIHGNNFLKTMVRLALGDPKRTLRVVNDQFGSLTWTHRLARQIEQLLSADITGIVHATAEGYGSWYDVAKRFLKTLDVPHIIEPCTTEEYPLPAPRPANSILENSVLKEKELNVMRSWEEDLGIFARRYRNELLAEAGK